MAESSSYTPIRAFRSETAGTTPALEDLAVGEMAINIADACIYTKNSSNQLVRIGWGDGVGGSVDTLEEYVTNVVNNLVEAYFRPTVITDTTTARTISADDETALIVFTNASAVTVTVPTDDTIIPIGFICHIHQQGDGEVTIAPENGNVTVNSSVSLSAARQYAALSLFKIGINSWVVVGDQS